MNGATQLLTLYSDVQTKFVDWIWYPYIASGKLTLLQGDPGDGKSTMMLQLIADLSRGCIMPDTKGKPKRVIYQCSEDGVEDTIKPRLVKMGANCKNIAFINETEYSGISLDDKRIREAMVEFRPALLVIDPIQAYIGSDADLQIAGRARKLMRRLAIWAEAYDCAIVLIGHMNKRESAKGLYRGLGSIDIVAAARSVLQVERDPNNPNIRVVSQIKNSLAGIGQDIRFEIRSDVGFRWLGSGPSYSAETGRPKVSDDKRVYSTKQEKAAHMLIQMLKAHDMTAKELLSALSQQGISEKTVRIAKDRVGITVYRKNYQWYWSLPKGEASDKQA